MLDLLMSLLGAAGCLFAIALASALSGRLIAAVLPLPRLRRCDALGVAATTVLGTIVWVLAAARLSELGLTEPRILVVLLAGHGVLAAVALRRRAALGLRPVGPVAD
jgi:HAMP domain-containing protein